VALFSVAADKTSSQDD